MLVQHVDILRHFLRSHFEHAGFGCDRSRHHLIQLIGKGDLAASSRLGVEPGDSRRHRRAPLPYFTEFRGKFGIVNPHQGLTLLDNRAFLHKDIADDAAFKRLDHLGLSRGHDTAVAPLDLVQNRKMSPDQKHHKKGEEGQQQHA